MHEELIGRGYSLPPVWSKGPRDAAPDAPPVWSFQEIPGDYLPGISSFALTYHKRSKGQFRKIIIPPNGIYAVSGATFVTGNPSARAMQWRDFLTPGVPVTKSRHGFHVQIGPHHVEWLSPVDFEARFGKEWLPAAHSCGELALLNLLVVDLEAAREMLQNAGRAVSDVSSTGGAELLVAPDERDGFAFTLRQKRVATWLDDRTALTGESLQKSTAS